MAAAENMKGGFIVELVVPIAIGMVELVLVVLLVVLVVLVVLVFSGFIGCPDSYRDGWLLGAGN